MEVSNHSLRTGQENMIIVLASIEVVADRRTKFLEEFHQIVPLVRAEQGCMEYGPTVDAQTGIDSQATDANCVTVVEKWESVAALEAHLAAPHMQSYRVRVKELVVGMELKILEPA
ncbi:MAG: putative quinol monooxygenase [Planctomycetaceae bacterium]